MCLPKDACSLYAWGDEIRLRVTVQPDFLVFGQPAKVEVTSEYGIPEGTAIPINTGVISTTLAGKPTYSPTDSVRVKLTAWGGDLKDRMITTDSNGHAKTTFTAGNIPGPYLITIEGISWDSPTKSNNVGRSFIHPPKASTYINIAPPVTGSGSYDVADFAVVLWADPSLLHVNEYGQIITEVSYKGHPDKGRKVELQWDGGNLEKSTGLTNSDGKFITNFSSPEEGVFTIQAKSQRLNENLEDTSSLDIPVITLPGGSSWGMAPPIATFSAHPTEGTVPLTVHFQDTTGEEKGIQNWMWDFGDGTSSKEQNPVHVYKSSEDFTVSLTVQNPYSTNTTVQRDLIKVHNFAVIDQIFSFFLSIPDIIKTLIAGNNAPHLVPSVPASSQVENSPCDDGNPCTVDDYYRGGYCMAGRKLFCRDDNPQTIDYCDPNVGCVYRSREEIPTLTTIPQDSTPCDDGNRCTVNDYYQNGICVGGQVLTCDDGNPDTANTCDPNSGCVFTPVRSGPADSTPCNDGNQCSVNDYYQSGVCVGGQALTCDDGNPDTVDTCEPYTGCVFTPLQIGPADGTPCEDGNLCTVNDYYQNGICVGGPAKSCDDGNPDTVDTCDPGRGACVHTSIPVEQGCPYPYTCMYESEAWSQFETYVRYSDTPCYIDYPTDMTRGKFYKYCYRQGT
jgi:PKD repeat protein